jgi:hypothetical protein
MPDITAIGGGDGDDNSTTVFEGMTRSQFTLALKEYDASKHVRLIRPISSPNFSRNLVLI